jgi:6-pyruvoyltetrahydropterin/6-carboxytetrahydropterin synthase
VTYKIAKRYKFSASHQIESLPDGHKCKRLHGHTYFVEVALSAEALDEHGFVTDYANIDATLGNFIKEHLDHRHLNDIFAQTSAEAIARAIYEVCDGANIGNVDSVTVKESPETWAKYTK